MFFCRVLGVDNDQSLTQEIYLDGGISFLILKSFGKNLEIQILRFVCRSNVKKTFLKSCQPFFSI